jgi:hypothetical protein
MHKMMQKEIELTPKQAMFVQARQPVCIYIGGWRAGKTFAGCCKVLHYILQNPGACVLVGRKTYRELYDTTRATFMQILPPDWLKMYKHSEDKAVIQPSRDDPPSIVLFRALDEFQKFGSLELAACYIDEATEFKDDSIFNFLMGRLSQRGYPPQIWLTANPASPTHWLYERFVSRAGGRDVYEDEELFFCRSRTVENPFIDPAYIELQLKQMPAKWRQRYLEGDWVELEGYEPIFPEYNEEHRAHNLRVSLAVPLYRGWDIGHAHPACVIAQWLPVAQKFNVLWAEVQSHMWMGDFLKYVETVTHVLMSEALANADPTSVVWGARFSIIDVAGHDAKAHYPTSDKSVIEIFREHGITLHTVYSNMLDRVRAMHELLSKRSREGGAMLQVDVERAKIIDDGFRGGYSWKPNTGELKVDTRHISVHAMDALGFIILKAMPWTLRGTQSSVPLIDVPSPTYGVI